jgi:uncharacterized membrane protein
MLGVMSERSWVCSHCGEIVRGAMCRRCGQNASVNAPFGPDPGSYLSILGYHGMNGFKFIGLCMLFIVAISFGINGLFGVGVVLAIAFAVVSLPAVILAGQLLWKLLRR